MTVQAQNLVQYYEGPINIGTSLPINEFTFMDNSHVAAKIRGENDNWLYGTDYTISGATTSTRNITLLKAVPIGKIFAAFLEVPITQGLAPEEGGNFPAATQELSLDKLTYICQMLYSRVKRSVQVSIDSNFDGLLYDSASQIGKAIIINETGTGLTYSTDKVNDIMALVKSILTQVQTLEGSASTSATNASNSASAASTSASNASTSADRAEAAASSLESIVPATGDEGKFLQVDKTNFSNGYHFVNINPQLPVSTLGNVSTNINVNTNTVTKVELQTAINITLPTGLDSTIENRCIIDFSSTTKVPPILITSGVLCWSSINDNRKPDIVSTLSTLRNQLICSTIDGGVHWNIEYRTYQERSADTVIYGYYIDTTDSNPNTRVHYVQDNANFANPAYMNFTSDVFSYGDWVNPFFMPQPVMQRQTGAMDYALQINDYTKKLDGTASDIGNTAYAGNAMTRWPTIWTKRYTDGNYQYVLKSNKQVDSSYKAWSWYDANNNLIPYCYMHIYQPANISGVLRSLSGQTILTNVDGTTEINYAKANGAANGWYTGVWADWVELQELLVLMSKSTDIQGKFGQGHSSAANAVTGECNTKGLFYGTNGNGPLKLFGIENPYGNYWKRLAGCVYTASGWKVKMTAGTIDGSTVSAYNSDGTGYLTPGITVSGTSGGYISGATMTPYGLLPNNLSGSSSTYLCDGCWYASGGYAIVGGAYNNGALDGAFALYGYNALSNAAAYIGSSLSCKPPS